MRNLERTIGTICRKQARRIAEGKTDKLVVTPELVQHTDMLGGMKIRTEGEIAERTKRAGVAVGLAWTPTGGDILFVEANKMKGKGGFTMTGQLGQVMQESMQAALTWVRSNAKELGIDEEFFADHDIHIHVPAGAIPEGRPLGGRDHGDGAGVAADRPAGASADGDDRRDHAERQRAAHRRHQGEDAGRQARRREGHHPAGREPPECAGRPDAGAACRG